MYGSGILFILLLNVQRAVAMADVCYILDGILVAYGIVLTILYCRLRMHSRYNMSSTENKAQGEGIYQDLKQHANDPYETLHLKKKPLK